jgi:hypothetical protein
VAVTSTGVVVPAIPPRPPQVSLATSAVRPTNSADPSNKIFEISPEQLAKLPDDLRRELQERQGDSWVRGFQYAPESHEAASLRGRCDFTSLDEEQLSPPGEVSLTEEAGKGTIALGAKTEYVLTVVDANGETTGSAAVKHTMVAEGGVLIKWRHNYEDGQKYRIYGRTEGGEMLLIAEVGPFDAEEIGKTKFLEFLDNKSKEPQAGKKVPVSNTTGGPSHFYTSPPIVTYIPVLIVAGDRCSSWGFEARDFKGRATRMNENATPRALENELWEGTISRKEGYENNFLANEATCVDLTPGVVPSIARGTQILQDALGQCGFGGQGMIHVQAQTAPNLLGARRVGQMFYDIFDNIVIPGVGYTGFGPGNKAPPAGEAYIYATDLVMVREGEIEVFPDTFEEALDRGQSGFPNTITFRAERFGAAYFDGTCHFACKVKLAT